LGVEFLELVFGDVGGVLFDFVDEVGTLWVT
jgi:hypothetical protein